MPEERSTRTNRSRPLIQLDDGGEAPILSYNVPQPAEYTGRNYVELEFDEDIWTDDARNRPEPIPRPDTTGSSDDGSSSVPPLGLPPSYIDPDEWIDVVWGGNPAPIDPTDGGVVDPESPLVHDEVVGVPMDVALPDDDRRRLSEVLFTEAMLETVVEESPESLPLLFGALSVTERAIEGPDAAAAGSSEAEGAMDSTGVVARDRLATRTQTQIMRMTDDANSVGAVDATTGRIEATQPGVDTTVDPGIDPAYAELFERYGTEFVRNRIDEGWRIHEGLTFSGKVAYDLAPPASDEGATPRLALVETYKLSNYLGNYGAGRTVQTFSLLPGEKHSISVNTYRNSKATRKEASSILDSYEESTADEYGEQLERENSRRDTAEENFSYHAEAKADASWGWGSAEVSGGVAGSSAAAREEFAKNVASSTSKHAAKAASKRNVEVNTSSETSVETGEETATERVIENINLSRTLNFVFRQMNQEFISLLHLVDARVAFHNGDPSTYREVTLSELDGLLEEVVAPDHHEDVREAIWDSLFYVFDYNGVHVPFVEEHELVDADGEALRDEAGNAMSYWRTIPGRTTYVENGISVDGVICSATTVSLPTDGVIVEALLGQGDALDDYSTALQTEAVREKAVANDRSAESVDLEQLRHDVVQAGDEDAAKLLAMLYRADENGAETNRQPVRP